MKRDKCGKGVSRRLRAKELIPGVIYGQELEETVLVTMGRRDLKKILESGHRRNTVLNVKFEGDSGDGILAMLYDYQYHPSTRELLHADFITVNPEREVKVNVPLRTSGKSVGVLKGGLLMEVFKQIPVVCLPEKIPIAITVWVEELDIGQSLKVADLELPEGVQVLLADEQPVISVTTVKEEKEVAEVTPEEAEAAAAAEGEKKPEEGEEKKEGEKKDEKKDERKEKKEEKRK
ncbi:MAG: 50S ribosomal protein L25 [Pseudomonadota bacterium]